MSENKLNLLVKFTGVDKLSGAIRNIMGGAKGGAASIRGMQREVRLMEKDLAKVNRQMAKGGGAGLSMAQRELTEAIARSNAEIDQQKTKLERLGAVQTKISGIADATGKAGAAMSIGITTPLVAFGATAIQASRDAAAAVAQVTASLSSMGPVAGRNLAQLQAQANALMSTSLFDDDEILRSVTANLLTFGKVTGQTFDRAQQAAVNLSAKLGTDLQGSALMLGKALNDPVKGVTALTRAGVSFTAAQKDMIKSMVKAGNTAGAQNIILAEMDKQFAGSAAAARAADPAGAMAISMGEFQQAVGDKLLPALTPLVLKLTDLADAFGNLSPGMQSAIVGGGAVLALAGPLLLGISGVASVVGMLAPLFVVSGGAGVVAAAGVGAAGVAAGGAATGFGALAVAALPVIATVAAIAGAAYLIYSNWGSISGFFQRSWSAISGAVTNNWTTIRNVLLGAVVIFMPLVAAAMWVGAVIYRNWDKIKVATMSVVSTVAGIVGPFIQPFVTISNFMAGLVGKFFGFGANIVSGLINGIISMTGSVIRAIINLAAGVGGKFASLLGIQSPSRLFMEMGGHITDGLQIGVNRGQQRPVQAVGRMATAVAGAGALAISPPAAATQGGNTIQNTFQITQQAGEDSEALAQRVAQLVDRAQRQRSLRSYEDSF